MKNSLRPNRKMDPVILGQRRLMSPHEQDRHSGRKARLQRDSVGSIQTPSLQKARQRHTRSGNI